MYENILDFKSYQIEDEVVGELDSNDLVELEREYVELTHMTSHLDMIGRMVERVCEVEVQIKDPSLTLKEQRILSNSVKRMSSLFMNSTGVEIALESASDEPALEVAKTLKKWWDALMKFLKSIWEKTKAFFKKVFSVKKKIVKEVVSMKTVYEDQRAAQPDLTYHAAHMVLTDTGQTSTGHWYLSNLDKVNDQLKELAGMCKSVSAFSTFSLEEVKDSIKDKKNF